MNTEWDQNFTLLSENWAVVLLEEQRADSRSEAKLAAEWESAFDRLKSRFNTLIEENLWVRGSRDFLSIIGLARSELHHCAVITWLLDPLGSHGLGVQFLAGVLEICFPEGTFEELAFSQVATEVSSADTRADIIVYGRTWTLVIEAKVNADEGHRQCDRLFREFSPYPKPRFVFLTPRGLRPRTATGDAAEAFVPLGFRQLRVLLQDCTSRQENDPLVGSYLTTLLKEFG